MEAKTTVVIINYNDTNYLKLCIGSLLSQTYRDFEIFFIDNNSPDKSGVELAKNYSSIKVIENDENIGYAKAANQAIKLAIENNSEYVLISNPDIVYTDDYLEKIIARIEKSPEVAAICGKIYKYDFDRQTPTNIIDSVGLFAYKNRRVIDDGQGIIDEGQFNREKEVFGISGACPLYRVKALENIKIFDEYFDEDFFMYKEDVDISWRFLLYGWKSIFYPQAIAYHGRGTGVFRRFFNKEILKNRNRLSQFQKTHSFKNHRLMITKNELIGNFFQDFFPILWHKIGTFIYITFKEPFLWKSYFTFLKQLPKALKKRKIIMQNKKVTAKEMKKWFKKQSEYLS